MNYSLHLQGSLWHWFSLRTLSSARATPKSVEVDSKQNSNLPLQLSNFHRCSVFDMVLLGTNVYKRRLSSSCSNFLYTSRTSAFANRRRINQTFAGLPLQQANEACLRSQLGAYFSDWSPPVWSRSQIPTCVQMIEPADSGLSPFNPARFQWSCERGWCQPPGWRRGNAYVF